MAWHQRGRAEFNLPPKSAWAVCDRCGFLYSHHKLRWQYQWAGTQLLNLKLLVCPECFDKPQSQLKTVKLPADPMPIKNPRPEPYAQDEAAGSTTNWDLGGDYDTVGQNWDEVPE